MDQGATITVKITNNAASITAKIPIPNGIVGYNDGGSDFSNNFGKNIPFGFLYI